MVSAKKSRSSTSSTSTSTPTKSTSTPKSTPKSTTQQTQSKDDLIDSHVSSIQAQKAFTALSSYISKRDSESSSNQLPLDSTSPKTSTIHLQITVKKLHNTKMIKPIRIPLKHSLNSSDVSICLLVKDPQREYKDLLTTLNIKSIERVVGVSKLKGKFKPFDARRALINDHDLFLADERITPLLPKLLGKKWFDAKKQPVSVDLTHPKKLKEEIERAISSTYYIQNKGSCSTVKIGSISLHTPSQLVENLSASLPKIISRIPGGWSNVQGIDIKTSNSIALPIWNCKLGQDGEDSRWNGMEVREELYDEEEDDDEGEDDRDEDDEDEDGEKVETIHISQINKNPSSSKQFKSKKSSSSISKEIKTKSNGKSNQIKKVEKAVKSVPEISLDGDKKEKSKKKVSTTKVSIENSSASAATKKKLAGIKKLEKKA